MLRVFYSKSKDQFLIVDQWDRIIEVIHMVDGKVRVFAVRGYLRKSHVYVGEF